MSVYTIDCSCVDTRKCPGLGSVHTSITVAGGGAEVTRAEVGVASLPNLAVATRLSRIARLGQSSPSWQPGNWFWKEE